MTTEKVLTTEMSLTKTVRQEWRRIILLCCFANVEFVYFDVLRNYYPANSDHCLFWVLGSGFWYIHPTLVVLVIVVAFEVQFMDSSKAEIHTKSLISLRHSKKVAA